jgi:hypothetical protein
MLPRVCSVLSIAAIISSFLLGLVRAAGEVQMRIGNETIERVSSAQVYFWLWYKNRLILEIPY